MLGDPHRAAKRLCRLIFMSTLDHIESYLHNVLASAVNLAARQ